MISKDIPLKRDWMTLILSLVNRYIQCVGYFAAMFLRRHPCPTGDHPGAERQHHTRSQSPWTVGLTAIQWCER